MNYYTFHSGDYLRDTSHLTLIEDAIYRRLIDWYYTNESPLPNDIKKISRLIRAVGDEDIVGVIVEEFFQLSENEWHQCRCDEEIAIYHGKAEKARENGKLGGRPKTKQKPNHNLEETESVIFDNQEISESKANQEPRTKNQEPTLNKKENASEDLEIQDVSHLYVAPNRRTYAMFAEWQPEPKTWAAYLKMSSHIVKPEQFTKYTLLEFIRSNVGNGEKMESEWQKFYVNAIARGYIKPEGKESKPTNQPEPAIDYTKPQNLIKPIIYEYDPEERARQSAEMKRIRKEQGR